MHDPYKALYIHVPFCAKRCLYCDFSTKAVPLDSPLVEEYMERTILDIRRAGKDDKLGSIETVYIGGGTPSYIGLKHITQLVYTLSLSMHLTEDVECSMEANPDSLTQAMCKDLWALGVNRLSIGVQSFDDAVLETLGRIHDADAALRAIECAQQRFDNVSIDLMCGIPGQSIESFERSLRMAVASGVRHVSVYPLTIEDGTPFSYLVGSGQLPPVDDDVEADAMELAQEILEDAGFARYEVASYAKPGYACRHNCAYWSGVPYLGIGPSAVTMTQNETRRMRVQDGAVIDDLNPRQMLAEDLMMAMRKCQGADEALMGRALREFDDLPDTIDALVGRGLATYDQRVLAPTQLGWLCGNELYGALFDLAP